MILILKQDEPLRMNHLFVGIGPNEEPTHVEARSTSEPPTPVKGPINLAITPLPFKKRSTYKTPKRYKSLKQILSMEKNQNDNPNIPTFKSIEAPPPLIPPKKYCDITGLRAPYVDPKSRLRYHSSEIYSHIKELAGPVIQEYLSLRNAAMLLK